jgi:hypothetical protein
LKSNFDFHFVFSIFIWFHFKYFFLFNIWNKQINNFLFHFLVNSDSVLIFLRDLELSRIKAQYALKMFMQKNHILRHSSEELFKFVNRISISIIYLKLRSNANLKANENTVWFKSINKIWMISDIELSHQLLLFLLK